MAEGVLLYGMNPARRRQEVVQRFVNDVLADGKPRGKAHQVSVVPPEVYQRLRGLGYLQTDHIFLLDNTILKYRNHPKGKKGATLPFDQFWKLANIARNPKNAYMDGKRGGLVFVFASRYGKGKVVKVVVEPNYKFKGRIINAITSIGVIDSREMKHPQFLKIK